MSDPNTCLHNIIRPGQRDGSPIYMCDSCLSTVTDEMRGDRKYDFDDEHGCWVYRPGNESRHPLLGVRDSRKFKIYREEFPGLFRFNGEFFEESWDDDASVVWQSVRVEYVEFKLKEYERERDEALSALRRKLTGWD